MTREENLGRMTVKQLKKNFEYLEKRYRELERLDKKMGILSSATNWLRSQRKAGASATEGSPNAPSETYQGSYQIKSAQEKKHGILVDIYDKIKGLEKHIKTISNATEKTKVEYNNQTENNINKTSNDIKISAGSLLDDEELKNKIRTDAENLGDLEQRNKLKKILVDAVQETYPKFITLSQLPDFYAKYIEASQTAKELDIKSAQDTVSQHGAAGGDLSTIEEGVEGGLDITAAPKTNDKYREDINKYIGNITNEGSPPYESNYVDLLTNEISLYIKSILNSGASDRTAASFADDRAAAASFADDRAAAAPLSLEGITVSVDNAQEIKDLENFLKEKCNENKHNEEIITAIFAGIKDACQSCGVNEGIFCVTDANNNLEPLIKTITDDKIKKEISKDQPHYFYCEPHILAKKDKDISNIGAKNEGGYIEKIREKLKSKNDQSWEVPIRGFIKEYKELNNGNKDKNLQSWKNTYLDLFIALHNGDNSKFEQKLANFVRVGDSIYGEDQHKEIFKLAVTHLSILIEEKLESVSPVKPEDYKAIKYKILHEFSADKYKFYLKPDIFIEVAQQEISSNKASLMQPASLLTGREVSLSSSRSSSPSSTSDTEEPYESGLPDEQIVSLEVILFDEQVPQMQQANPQDVNSEQDVSQDGSTESSGRGNDATQSPSPPPPPPPSLSDRSGEGSSLEVEGADTSREGTNAADNTTRSTSPQTPTGATSPQTPTGTTSSPTPPNSPKSEGSAERRSAERGRINNKEMLENHAARQAGSLDVRTKFSGRGDIQESTERELSQKFIALQIESISGIKGAISQQKERGNTKKTEVWEKLKKFLWQDLYYTAMADKNMDDNTKILLMMCCPDKILEELKKFPIKDNNQEYNSYVELIKNNDKSHKTAVLSGARSGNNTPQQKGSNKNDHYRIAAENMKKMAAGKDNVGNDPQAKCNFFANKKFFENILKDSKKARYLVACGDIATAVKLDKFINEYQKEEFQGKIQSYEKQSWPGRSASSTPSMVSPREKRAPSAPGR
jgi:hypothetical protein